MGIMTHAVRTFKLLGCEFMFCTNAAGSLNPNIPAGSLVVLNDHINTMPSTPLVGPNDDRFGQRFSASPTLMTKSFAKNCTTPRTVWASVCMKACLFPTRAELRNGSRNSHDAADWR